MKRTLGITLGAMALVAATAFAQDSTSTTSSSSTEPAAPAKHAMHHHAKGTAKHAMVDINAASKEDLMKLPGVTDEVADKIIAARPFKTRADLLSKKIVSRTEYKKIRGWVMAKS